MAEIAKNSISVIVLSSMDVEINSDNFEYVLNAIECLLRTLCSCRCKQDDNLFVIAVANPASVVTEEIAIGMAIGEIIITDNNTIPAPAITLDIKETATSIAVIFRLYFLFAFT